MRIGRGERVGGGDGLVRGCDREREVREGGRQSEGGKEAKYIHRIVWRGREGGRERERVRV